MSYSGNCHCGAVAFSVAAPMPTEAVSCNCSHCRRKGFLLTFVPREALTIERGEDSLQTYRFASERIAHQFCSTCGCQAFSSGKGPRGQEMASINLRCVPEADLEALTVQVYDGASH